MLDNVIAVDLGYGRVKALSAGRQLDFPSVVGPWRRIRYQTDVSTAGFLGNIAIEYAGKNLFIGDVVYRQSTAQMDMTKEKFSKLEGMALMNTAIALLHEPKKEIVCRLVTGLPVNLYASQKEKYTRALEGWHHLKFIGDRSPERRIKIEKCKVLPQPLGSVFGAVLDESGNLTNERLASSNLCVLDIGANTVDLCRMDALDFVDRESATFLDIGVFDCFRQLSVEIFNLLGVEIPPEEIEPHLRNKSIKVRGQRQSIIHVVDKVFREAAEKIAARARNVWRNIWQVDKILVTGGGAELFGDYIDQAFESTGLVEVSVRGVFANVVGYMRYGQRESTWQDPVNSSNE